MAVYEGPIEVGMTFHNGKGRRVRVDEKITFRGLPALVLAPLNKGGKKTTKDEDYFRWEFQPEDDAQPPIHEWSAESKPTGPDGVYLNGDSLSVRIGGVNFEFMFFEIASTSLGTPWGLSGRSMLDWVSGSTAVSGPSVGGSLLTAAAME